MVDGVVVVVDVTDVVADVVVVAEDVPDVVAELVPVEVAVVFSQF